MVKLPNKAKLFCALLVVLKRRQSLFIFFKEMTEIKMA